jgi:hypothetical protein
MEILKQRRLCYYVREIEQYWRPSSEISYVEKEERRNLTTNEKNLIRVAVQRAGFVGPQESAIINMLMQDTMQSAHSIKSFSRYGSR